jgi:hypothetical protein
MKSSLIVDPGRRYFWLGVTAASIGTKMMNGRAGTAHPFMGQKRLAGTASRR